MEDEFRVNWCTIRKWYIAQKWDDERHLTANTYKALCEHVRFLSDPNTTEEMKDQSNLSLARELMGFNLAHLKYAAITGDKSKLVELPMGLSDTLQKCIAAIEKSVTASNKLSNGGVERTEVKHLHLHGKSDKLDELLKLTLDARKKGHDVTVNDLARAASTMDKKEKR